MTSSTLGREKREVVETSPPVLGFRGISFEIGAGTTTGIIGPNGSGSSTLLQIMEMIMGRKEAFEADRPHEWVKRFEC